MLVLAVLREVMEAEPAVRAVHKGRARAGAQLGPPHLIL